MPPQTTEPLMANVKTDANAAIGVYPTYLEAETAFRELRNQGFDIRRMSIIGRVFHPDEFAVEDHTFCDYMEAWGKFLLIAHGSNDEIERAKGFLRPSKSPGAAERAA